MLVPRLQSLSVPVPVSVPVYKYMYVCMCICMYASSNQFDLLYMFDCISNYVLLCSGPKLAMTFGSRA